MVENRVGKQNGELAIRTLAMPADANPSGDIFGGWLISQMDIAGGITAGARAKGRVATIAVTGFTFHKPVLIGDVVCCYADIHKIGQRRNGQRGANTEGDRSGTEGMSITNCLLSECVNRSTPILAHSRNLSQSQTKYMSCALCTTSVQKSLCNFVIPS